MLSNDPPHGARVVAVATGWAIAEYSNCVAMVWRQQPDAAAFRTRAVALIDLAKRYPGRCALVEVVEPSSKPPPDPARKVAMEVFRQLGNDLSAVAFVLEGGVVQGALKRAVITGMMYFVRQPQPVKVCRSVPELAAWVKPRIKTEDPAFAQELHAVFEHLRAQITRR